GAEHHPQRPGWRADRGQLTDRLIRSAVAVPERADEERHCDVDDAGQNPTGEQRLAPSFDAAASVGTRRTAPLNAAQVPRFHSAMADSSKGDEQRTRKGREHSVRALDEDAAVTGGGGWGGGSPTM